MAIKAQSKTVKHRSFTGKMVIGALGLTFLGWFTLYGWSLWLWGRSDFESACLAVKDLSVQQAGLIKEFEEASLAIVLSHGLVQRLNEISTTLKTNVERTALDWQPLKSIQVDDGFAEWLNELQKNIARIWFLLKATGHVLLVKLAILVAAIPLFSLSVMAGLVDGLNQRAIRTASLGRESTYVFHKSIPFARKTLLLVLGLWLSLPVTLPPTPLFVGLSVLLSLVVSMSASRFKKYL